LLGWGRGDVDGCLESSCDYYGNVRVIFSGWLIIRNIALGCSSAPIRRYLSYSDCRLALCRSNFSHRAQNAIVNLESIALRAL
jgi:hypothetical protein